MSFQSDYDRYRQGIYNQGAAIVAAYNACADVTCKSGQTSQLVDLMNSFDAGTKAMLASTGNNSANVAYATPRFHDFYDFFEGIITGWKSALQNAGGAVGATTNGQTMPAGCTAGICGPVPIDSQSSSQLIAVPTGGANPPGITTVATSGGGGSIANNLPLQAGGVAPSPYQNDLPGLGGASTLTPPNTGEVLTAGVAGNFDLKKFFTGPMGLAILGGIVVILLLKNAKV